MISNYLIFIAGIVYACSFSIERHNFVCKNSQYILQKSQEIHDPQGVWDKAELSIYVQEPRLQNPLRYSVLSLNNRTGAFSLIRDSEMGEVERIIDEDGNASVLLNGSSQIDEDVIQKYRLGAERNAGYQSFYKRIYGLPMSVNENMWLYIEDAETTTLEGQEVYKIKIELKEAMISKHWELFISTKDYTLVALKFNHSEAPDRPDEIIRFDGEYSIDGITIPRFRHWYHEESGDYRGSDIIVK
jgi:hypothetical protein